MEPVVELLAVLSLSLSLYTCTHTQTLMYYKNSLLKLLWTNVCILGTRFLSVYYVGPSGWKKLSGDDVGELHYKYYPVTAGTVEQEMGEVGGA